MQQQKEEEKCTCIDGIMCEACKKGLPKKTLSDNPMLFWETKLTAD
jgi:hypothetical protein